MNDGQLIKEAGLKGYFTECEKQGSAHAPSGFARDGEPWLAAMQDCIASQVFPAASMGATHASRGWPSATRKCRGGPGTVTQGLGGARIAQRNAPPGLARSRDCEAQWIHGGPENTPSIRPTLANK